MNHFRKLLCSGGKSEESSQGPWRESGIEAVLFRVRVRKDITRKAAPNQVFGEFFWYGFWSGCPISGGFCQKWGFVGLYFYFFTSTASFTSCLSFSSLPASWNEFVIAALPFSTLVIK